MPSKYRAHRGGDSYTEDADRLPHGMVRCGYDADTQTYFFRDRRDGSTWEGTAGNYYGLMNRVSRARSLAPRAARPQTPEHNEAPSLDSEDREGRVDKLLIMVERLRERDDGGIGRRGFMRSNVWRDTVDQLVVSDRKRRASANSTSSLSVKEGKEARLRLIAAGQKRTILDIV